MSLTFTELTDKAEDWTKDDSSTNTTRLQDLINDKNQEVIGMKDWQFMEKERTSTSVADQQKYRLPADYGKLLELWTEVDDIKYTPDYVGDLKTWMAIDAQGTSTTSDITTKYTIIDDHLYLYPTSSSTDITIHMLYRRTAPIMEASDYTTGTVTVASGNRTVSGSGTTFTGTMVGRYIELGGLWYQIDSFTSTTEIDLEKPAIEAASGESTHIGEMSPIPGEFHDLLWKGAVAEYFALKGDQTGVELFEAKFAGRVNQLKARYSSKTAGNVIPPKHKTARVRSINDYPESLTS